MPPAPSTFHPVDITPVVLEGKRVCLEPMTQEHLPVLAQIAFEPSIWTWITRRVTTPDDLQSFVDDALNQMNAGTAVA